jgi:hypothetical protein
LRDTSRLQGKCWVFEFRNVCGGSRARAFAVTGNPFDEEPCCVYEPKAAAKAAGCKYTPSLIAALPNFSVGGEEPGFTGCGKTCGFSFVRFSGGRRTAVFGRCPGFLGA